MNAVLAAKTDVVDRRRYVIQRLRETRGEVKNRGIPGLPLTCFPPAVRPVINELVKTGVVELHTVTRRATATTGDVANTTYVRLIVDIDRRN